MIVCKLMGGLGNQMFQYAYAMWLAKELNDKMCLDVSFYKGKNPTLFRFQITEKTTTDKISLVDFASARRAQKIYHFFQYAIRKLNHEKIGEQLFHILSKQGYYFNFDPFYYPSVRCNKENKYVYGYFQGVQYFEPIASELKAQFRSDMGETAKRYERKIKECNAVAVHIRLGDYTKKKNKYLNVCTDVYYSNGINYIQNNVDAPTFFVFTNDVTAIQNKNYIPESAVIVSGTKDYEDLMLMKACRHFVISGSTFSWWASYLSDNENKITVAPRKWMTTIRDEPAITNRQDMIRVRTD